MLRRAVAVAVVVAAVCAGAPAAHADGEPSGGICAGVNQDVTVCASDGNGTPGRGAPPAGGTPGKAASKPTCTYTRLDPQPPPDNMYYRGHQAEKGSVYGVNCPGSGASHTLWIADGDAPDPAPLIDPQVLARRAVDSMRLVGPKVASPRAAGTYVIGMPMWMWVTQSPTTYGPNSAKASAGGVTVTAIARVTSVRWVMGDGKTITCNGPGTPYTSSTGMADSPDCGHHYVTVPRTKDQRFHGTATATWTIEWTADGVGDSGTFTEVRQSAFTARVHEVQVLN